MDLGLSLECTEKSTHITHIVIQINVIVAFKHWQKRRLQYYSLIMINVAYYNVLASEHHF